MTAEIIISVKNLTKQYNLYDKPADRLKEALHPFRRKYHRDFYALSDVSFDIAKGETVGIIGRNGAGKSTLLKIITGVVSPTWGSVEVRGKISSLLELGAGFNPEMTGIENVYMNGSIMGFSKQDMDSRLDAILEFADIGGFVHQPVKMYSSGMFARLAFAVAISVEPDILIVDEALSVGDVAFQNKCIRKMEDIRGRGATIIFVSHDTQVINKFCTKVFWFNDGRVINSGSPDKVIEDYLSFIQYGFRTERGGEAQREENGDRTLLSVAGLDSFGERRAVITGVGFFDSEGVPLTNLKQRSRVTFICEFSSSEDIYNVAVGVMFKDRLNHDILTFNSYMYDTAVEKVSAGSRVRAEISFIVPKILPGEYVVTVALSEGTQQNHTQQHWIHAAATVNIISRDFTDACIISLYSDEIEFKYDKI